MESGETGMDRSELIKVIKRVTLILGVMIVIFIAVIGYRLFFHTPAPVPTQHENAAAPAMVPSTPSQNVDYSAIPLDQPPGSAIARTACERQLALSHRHRRRRARPGDRRRRRAGPGDLHHRSRCGGYAAEALIRCARPG